MCFTGADSGPVAAMSSAARIARRSTSELTAPAALVLCTQLDECMPRPPLIGTVACSAVPSPGGLLMVIVPPSASTRSLRPSRPEPRAKSAPPRPSSRTRTRSTPSPASRWFDLDVHDRGVRVLGGVGQRLGDHVVGGDLDLLGQPPVDPHVRARRGRRSGGPAPSAPGPARPRRGPPGGCRGRARAARPGRRSASAASQSSCAASSTASGGTAACATAQLQRQRDQPLLGAVVQVPFDAAAGLVGGGHDPRPRGGQLRPGSRRWRGRWRPAR